MTKSPCRDCVDRPEKKQCGLIETCGRLKAWQDRTESDGLGQVVPAGRYSSARRRPCE